MIDEGEEKLKDITLHNGWLLVDVDEPAITTGVYIPKTITDTIVEGHIVASAQSSRETYGLEVGDFVHWIKYVEGEGQVTIDGKEYYKIKDEHIIFTRKETK